jgi:hypothetical protein
MSLKQYLILLDVDDYVHKDCYTIKGKGRKIRLNLEYDEALVFADDDINENWEIYREKFLRGEFP